ncbi:MAG: class I SAM-dependent methyltransferase [Candidatus Eremiobacteraeota bacterium]|nr:class I SAM-dependent methyltransferase [Candidatus Eremiobacteraeota bacterium]MBC5802242.1 class I SAM-dependent methyltransferase [Candidatus Eremiobacteraeota bacterium]MBC5820568.1 class I SAM-dependent methyltransferase [Candidatus Eremiobacteraeota bacterium]
MDAQFDRLHEAISASQAYCAAMHACSPTLPPWLHPASVVDRSDLERFAAEMHVGADETFVDFGCGNGAAGLWIAERTGASLIGVDVSRAAIAAAKTIARRRRLSSRSRFIVADAAATGLPGGNADALMSLDVLMFMEPRAAVREMRRLLKPQGIAVMRTVESLAEPFLPTLVRDYRPIFRDEQFTIVHDEHLPDHRGP